MVGWVWSYDFVATRISDGRGCRILVIINEYTRECLVMVVKRGITSKDVLEQLYFAPISLRCNQFA